MADNPVTPAEVSATIPASTGSICSRLTALWSLANVMDEWYSWAFNPDGSPSDDFIDSITSEFLFDAAKKGWFVQTNATTGLLELIEKLPLDGLDDGGAETHDTLVWNGTAWVPSSDFAVAFSSLPTSGGVTVPVVTSGGILSAEHGLSSTPLKFGAFIYMNTVIGDLGYVNGDRVQAQGLMAFDGSTGENTGAVSISVDDEKVYASFRDCDGGTSKYKLIRKDTSAIDQIISSRWNVVLWAEL